MFDAVKSKVKLEPTQNDGKDQAGLIFVNKSEAYNAKP